jgi:hypothetical protein
MVSIVSSNYVYVSLRSHPSIDQRYCRFGSFDSPFLTLNVLVSLLCSFRNHPKLESQVYCGSFLVMDMLFIMRPI